MPFLRRAVQAEVQVETVEPKLKLDETEEALKGDADDADDAPAPDPAEPTTPRRGWGRGLFRGRQQQQEDDDRDDNDGDSGEVNRTADGGTTRKLQSTGDGDGDAASSASNRTAYSTQDHAEEGVDGETNSPDAPDPGTPRRGWGRRLFRGRQGQDQEQDGV